MSKDDAPNLRSIDLNTCVTCEHYAITIWYEDNNEQ